MPPAPPNPLRMGSAVGTDRSLGPDLTFGLVGPEYRHEKDRACDREQYTRKIAGPRNDELGPCERGRETHPQTHRDHRDSLGRHLEPEQH